MVKPFARFLRRLHVEIGSAAAALLQVGVLAAAALRGLDYIALPTALTPTTLTIVEKALSFDTWGWLYLGAGAMGLAGIFIPRLPLTTLAHAALFGLYLAFGVGALAQVGERDLLYGWRTGVGWILGAAVIHLVLTDASIDGWRKARAR